jgi:hypothetical protein
MLIVYIVLIIMEKKTATQVKDLLIEKTSEIVREKLIGHKAAVNSLDIYSPEASD